MDESARPDEHRTYSRISHSLTSLLIKSSSSYNLLDNSTFKVGPRQTKAHEAHAQEDPRPHKLQEHRPHHLRLLEGRRRRNPQIRDRARPAHRGPLQGDREGAGRASAGQRFRGPEGKHGEQHIHARRPESVLRPAPGTEFSERPRPLVAQLVVEPQRLVERARDDEREPRTITTGLLGGYGGCGGAGK